MRQAFDQFACVRPARTYPGVPMPLSANPTVDMIVVRENSEGEYVNNGGRFSKGQPNEVAIQSAVHTRKGVERVLRHGFELAMLPERRQKLTMVTKSNAQKYAMVLWDDVLDDLAPEYPSVAADKQHIDAISMNFVRMPEEFDIVVASNLFGECTPIAIFNLHLPLCFCGRNRYYVRLHCLLVVSIQIERLLFSFWVTLTNHTTQRLLGYLDLH
jgi:tartrate dehydrogenase/decarboxylase/D-malate dehydrogenase|eukprot:COSAG06_NODE_5_length_38423_cov_121.612645_32_plen_214_part_00